VATIFPNWRGREAVTTSFLTIIIYIAAPCIWEQGSLRFVPVKLPISNGFVAFSFKPTSAINYIISPSLLNISKPIPWENRPFQHIFSADRKTLPLFPTGFKGSLLSQTIWFFNPHLRRVYSNLPSHQYLQNLAIHGNNPFRPQWICFFQSRFVFKGFNQKPGFPDSLLWLHHAIRPNYIHTQFKERFTVSFHGLKVGMGAISCLFHEGASNQ